MNPTALSAAFLLCASLAQAGELRQQAAIELELNSNGLVNATLDLPKFPAGLGPLRAANFEVTLAMNNLVGIENLGHGPAVVEHSFTQALMVSLPDGSPLAVTQAQAQGLGLFQGFDGALDFGGGSGLTQDYSARQVQQSAFLSAPAFLATPGDSSLALQIDAFTDLSCTSSTQLASALRSRGSVTVEVVYNY